MNLKVLASDKYNAYIYILFIVLVFKNICFQYFCFDPFLPKDIEGDALRIALFWGRKLFAPFLITCFAFLLKRHWAMHILLFLIDGWIIANLTYHKFYDDFFALNAVSCLGNLRGFESSVIALMEWRWLAFPISTILTIITSIFTGKRRCVKAFFVGLALYYFACIGNNVIELKSFPKDGEDILAEAGISYTSIFNPLTDIKITIYKYPNNWFSPNIVTEMYTSRYNVMARFVQMLFSGKQDLLLFEGGTVTLAEGEKQVLTDDILQSDELKYIFREKESFENKGTNLILILVESFESWVLEDSRICPNMHSFIKKNNVFFADKLKCQIQKGISSDGQFILNTGLLPIVEGIIVIDYPYNTYPNLAHFYKNSLIVNPEIDVWNQRCMTKCYGYNGQVGKTDTEAQWKDQDIADKNNEIMDLLKADFCIQTITMSTHMPFNFVNSSFVDENSEKYHDINNYVKTFHYADSCIGIILDKFVESKYFDNTVLVITGDHTILNRAEYHKQFCDYRTEQGKYTEHYTPFIMYSPDFDSAEHYDSLCYQMDMFPTILSAIGHNKYKYKGLGVDLRDTTERENRFISPEKASYLSDKLIRANYFKEVELE